MKYISNIYEWRRLPKLDRYTHDMIHRMDGYGRKKVKVTAMELAMTAIRREFEDLINEHEEYNDKLSASNKKILKALAKIHNDFGYKVAGQSGDFDHLEVEYEEGN